MKATLCSRDLLPVELICIQSPRVQSDEDLDRWVPTYPGGSQIHDNNLNMGFAEVQAGQALRINLVASDLIIWVEGRIPRSPKFCLEDTNSGEKWWIHLHTSEDVSMVSNSLHYPTRLFLNKRAMLEHTVQGHGYCGLGAVLSLARLDEKGIRAVFDDSFSFGLWSWVQTHPDFDDLSVVAGTVLPSKDHILIESEILEQYKQLQRRSYISARLTPARATLLAIASCMGSLMALAGCLLALLSRHLPNTSVGPTLSDFGIVLASCGVSIPLALLLIIGIAGREAYHASKQSFNDGEMIERSRFHRILEFGPPSPIDLETAKFLQLVGIGDGHL